MDSDFTATAGGLKVSLRVSQRNGVVWSVDCLGYRGPGSKGDSEEEGYAVCMRVSVR